MTEPKGTPEDRAEDMRLAQKRFVGGLVIALGAVIAFLCGQCSLYWLVDTLVSGATGRSSGSNVLGMAILVLIVGGLPTAVGVTLVVIGVRIHREGRS